MQVQWPNVTPRSEFGFALMILQRSCICQYPPPRVDLTRYLQRACRNHFTSRTALCTSYSTPRSQWLVILALLCLSLQHSCIHTNVLRYLPCPARFSLSCNRPTGLSLNYPPSPCIPRYPPRPSTSPDEPADNGHTHVVVRFPPSSYQTRRKLLPRGSWNHPTGPTLTIFATFLHTSKDMSCPHTPITQRSYKDKQAYTCRGTLPTSHSSTLPSTSPSTYRPLMPSFRPIYFSIPAIWSHMHMHDASPVSPDTLRRTRNPDMPCLKCTYQKNSGFAIPAIRVAICERRGCGHPFPLRCELGVFGRSEGKS